MRAEGDTGQGAFFCAQTSMQPDKPLKRQLGPKNLRTDAYTP